MSTTTPPTVTTDVVGRTATIRLTRPERRNAITPGMLAVIRDAARSPALDEVDVVVLAAAGPDFSVGFDLDAFDDGSFDGAHLGGEAVAALRNLPMVTIAVVSGWVVGGGAALAAACDLRIGDRTTTVKIPEVPLGIPLGWGAIPLLVGELGPSVTMDLVVTGRTVDADEALQRGLLTRLVDELGAGTDDLVAQVLAAPRGPARTTKRQVAEAAAVIHTGDADAERLLAAVADPAFAAWFAEYRSRVGRGR